MQAHGTGTPQNRVTESAILNRWAEAFGIEQWPVAAIKSYVGHSLGAASGDQLTATLGMWQYGVMPGIGTINAIADDVYQSNLKFAIKHEELAARDYALINSKGFGGNNATAAVLSPRSTHSLLAQVHGESAMAAWAKANESVEAQRQNTESERLKGNWSPSYFFDAGVLQDGEIEITANTLKLGDKVVELGTAVPHNWRLD